MDNRSQYSVDFWSRSDLVAFGGNFYFLRIFIGFSLFDSLLYIILNKGSDGLIRIWNTKTFELQHKLIGAPVGIEKFLENS